MLLTTQRRWAADILCGFLKVHFLCSESANEFHGIYPWFGLVLLIKISSEPKCISKENDAPFISQRCQDGNMKIKTGRTYNMLN